MGAFYFSVAKGVPVSQVDCLDDLAQSRKIKYWELPSPTVSNKLRGNLPFLADKAGHFFRSRLREALNRALKPYSLTQANEQSNTKALYAHLPFTLTNGLQKNQDAGRFAALPAPSFVLLLKDFGMWSCGWSHSLLPAWPKLPHT